MKARWKTFIYLVASTAQRLFIRRKRDVNDFPKMAQSDDVGYLFGHEAKALVVCLAFNNAS